MSATNHQVRLAARPVGEPRPTDWEHTREPVGEPADGEFLVQVLYLSIDPAMRGWMNAGRSYIRPVEIGEVMRAGAIGRVIASRHPGFAVGDHVSGSFGVQEYCVSDGRGVTTVDPAAAPLPTYLGALGMSGLTAYFGLVDIGRPEPGQTVVVSGAAGAVGSVAGQVAKALGCRVVGIAGGEEKCRLVVDEFGFDAAIDYRGEDIRKALRTHAPDGVDVYFDNVGGDVLDAVLPRLARGARVIVCGAVSQYNSTEPKGPANYLSLLVNRATMTGMVVFDYADRYAEGVARLAAWRAEGRLTSLEDVATGGVAAFPDTLMRLFRGENHGKLVLKIAD
ncbi:MULTISPECIES: NADP-dependent oxidoreductase [unclassified Streptomyces]|uniref:NADP-dependent oxidoreductase n=1 Tax=unclassified Streptomyces TaxID=2593676 RepID=UPI0007486DC4|nr:MULTISPECIES: NADP-dependent oxidoreductase [unclassified Streptomyces]KUL70639.1 NADP-dependent oxidoreductase [Streptomyces sp. NRRL WC-3605]KUL80319.1 NADP-dependent oxidoreductase [Streptomyces sp. NRRL WC-3604]